MVFARIAKLLLCGSVITLPPLCAAQRAQDQPLQLNIQQTSQQPVLFQAVLRNTGSETLHLILGTEFANWSRMFSIHLILTDSLGKTMPLDIKYHYSADADTVSRLIKLKDVLQPGEAFSFSIALGDYLTHPLAPGQYTVRAIYFGEDKHADSAHMPPEYWLGRITSNSLTLSIPEEPAPQPQNTSPIQLTIHQTSRKPAFRVDLHDSGKQPVQLFLAMENGGIFLSLTDPTGNTDEEASKRGIVPEHIGLIPVTLQPRETHSFPIDLGDYTSPEQWNLSLAPGRYTIQAETYSICPSLFIEHPPPLSYPCWKGEVISTPLSFTVPAP
jgi:hypothetical protein